MDAGEVLSLMDAAEPPTVGGRIRGLVEGRGWTMAHAAELAGMSPAQLNNLAADRQSPTVDTLQRLAAAWGCELRDMVP